MHEFTRVIVQSAENKAESGNKAAALQELRKLSLDDFGLLMWSMPNHRWPALSTVLPKMADEKVQKRFTGATGHELLKKTLSFVRQMENNYVRYAGRFLRDETVLDFGVGYGRMVRLLYYYTDPSKIWGLDPQQDALNTCKSDGLSANFRLSDTIPVSLPTDGIKFDLAYAFSVFSHLSPKSAAACLDSVRDSIRPGGLFMPTIWPPEIWAFLDQQNGTSYAKDKMREFKESGFAYVPHAGKWGETYGNATVAMDFFKRSGWELLGYDSTLTDVFQITLILRRT
jgi:SAM-dependent methyltransferase